MAQRADRGFWERLGPRGNPVANPANVVVRGQARFTALTARLLRLEWAADGRFDDRATYAFPQRDGPAVAIDLREDGAELQIDTGALRLRYRGPGNFTADSLEIAFALNGAPQRWQPGMRDPANLRGTRRTLDVCAGEVPLEAGLVSRAGWALVDDSAAVPLDESGWVVARDGGERQDWYFFGYGHDYVGALRDYQHFGGAVPLIPRFVLGAWWSRYWSYTDADLKELVASFRAHDLPLDVLVLDMDWHLPDGWTGYTWNRELFPDPPAFLRWVHAQGLRTTLNLHPADGVQRFEERYPEFAAALGVDPTTEQTIPFQITDRRFVQPYFELLHHPLEDEGVDFWWMDWQQGTTTAIQGLDPLPWLNHLHFRDSTRRGSRAMLYSRWGGLGNHRYPIGFSGDTYATWAALQFQPYFTSAAANVLYGWWSHDIGGHIGATEPELFTRWVQYGALSPCLRLHAMKDPLAERRPWAYPPEVLQAAQAAFALRYSLVPYLYTMARAANDTGVALCRPMYYAAPEADAAYLARQQYMLGDDLLAAPVVHPADPATGLAAVDVWVPDGEWLAFDTLERYAGPGWVRIFADLGRIPLLVRAGAIVPLAEPAPTTDAQPRDHLILALYPGSAGTFRLYEDDGTTDAYTRGELEWTMLRQRTEDEVRLIEIGAVEGACAGLPRERRYTLRVLGTAEPSAVTVDGSTTTDWRYDAAEQRLEIAVPPRPKSRPVRVEVRAGQAAERGTALIAADLGRLLGHQPGAPTAAAQTAPLELRSDAMARIGGPFAHTLAFATPDEASEQLGWLTVAAPADGSPYTADVTWRLRRGLAVEEQTAAFHDTRDTLHLACPFRYDGAVVALRWEAEVDFTWQGTRWTSRFTSPPLFPGASTLLALVYNTAEQQLALSDVYDAERGLADGLPWEHWVQDPATMEVQNLTTPFGIRFVARYRPRLRAGEPLAAWVAAVVTSPDDRAAVVEFPTLSPTTLYVNGATVATATATDAPGDPTFPSFFQPRRSAPIQLRAGRNVVLLRSEPPGGGWWWAWSAGAVFEHPDGTLMPDLVFDV